MDSMKNSKLSGIMKMDNGLKLNVFYNKLYFEYDMPPHQHDRIEFLCVEQGVNNIDIYTDDEFKTIKLKEFEVLIINAGVKHRMHINSTSGCKVFNLEFSSYKHKPQLKCFSLNHISAASPVFEEFVSEFGDYLYMRECKGIVETVKEILTISIQVQTSETLYIQNLLINKLLVLVAMDYKNNVNFSGTKYIKQALNYIHNNFEYDIKIKDIANDVLIHPTYLEDLFKQQMGKPPIEYINTIRINKAKKILLNSDIPAIEVGFQVGFNSRQHFARTFKTFVGVSPADYRKNEKKKSYQSWTGVGDSFGT